MPQGHGILMPCLCNASHSGFMGMHEDGENLLASSRPALLDMGLCFTSRKPFPSLLVLSCYTWSPSSMGEHGVPENFRAPGPENFIRMLVTAIGVLGVHWFLGCGRPWNRMSCSPISIPILVAVSQTDYECQKFVLVCPLGCFSLDVDCSKLVCCKLAQSVSIISDNFLQIHPHFLLSCA